MLKGHAPLFHVEKQKSTAMFHLRAFPNVDGGNKMPRMTKDSHRYLKLWREHRGFTQDQVVDRLVIHEDEKLPCSKAQLSKVENGKSPYSQRLLEALADIYACETWELIGRNPTKEGEVVDFWAALTKAQREKVAAFAEGLKQAEGA